MGGIAEKLRKIVAPAVQGLGYELVGVQYISNKKQSVVRVFIDRPMGVEGVGGIGLDDCEQVSHQITGVLAVEDPIPSQYSLEVSSPGLDRPLFTPDHFQRFAGHRVRVRLVPPLQGQVVGRRKIKREDVVKGELVGCRIEVGSDSEIHSDSSAKVLVREDGVLHEIPLDRIRLARIIPAS